MPDAVLGSGTRGEDLWGELIIGKFTLGWTQRPATPRALGWVPWGPILAGHPASLTLSLHVCGVSIWIKNISRVSPFLVLRLFILPATLGEG